MKSADMLVDGNTEQLYFLRT